MEPNWHPNEWLGDQHPDKQDQLIDMRGGCRCCISPPCFACTEPITDEEAEHLELVPFPEVQPARPTDYLKAVHDLCR